MTHIDTSWHRRRVDAFTGLDTFTGKPQGHVTHVCVFVCVRERERVCVCV